jgi:hypothetical protein
VPLVVDQPGRQARHKLDDSAAVYVEASRDWRGRGARVHLFHRVAQVLRRAGAERRGAGRRHRALGRLDNLGSLTGNFAMTKRLAPAAFA